MGKTIKQLSQPFDKAMSDWNAYQDAPWGKLRYRVANANLEKHLPKRPLTILDVGGGNGVDAIHLAKQGHAVTVVDFSAEMLVQGRQLAEANGVADKISFQQAAVGDLGNLFLEPTFDLLLCHNVLQYVENVTAVLHALNQLLHPNGLLSLIITNPHAETYAKAFRDFDMAGALAEIDKKEHYVATFDTTIQRYTDDELKGMLETAVFTLVKQYGIRSVCDFISDNDLKYKPDFYEQLEALEIALSDKYPYYLLARFYHLIAQKENS